MAYGWLNVRSSKDIPNASIIAADLRDVVWADTHAGETTDTLERVYYRHARVGQHCLFREDNGCSRCRRLSLGDGLIQEFRIMCQTCHENTLSSEVHRSQFDMSLEEKAIHINGQLELAGEILRAFGRDYGCAQHQQIRL